MKRYTTLVAVFLLLVFAQISSETLSLTVKKLGLLNFIEASSLEELQSLLEASSGRVLIFIYDDFCPGCMYMINNVFTAPALAEFLEENNVTLVSVDLTYTKLDFIEASSEGSVLVVSPQGSSRNAVQGLVRIPIVGTPTLIYGCSSGSKFYVHLVVIGAVESYRKLIDYIANSGCDITGAAEAQSTSFVIFTPAILALIYILGVVSAFSPCVLPVIGLMGLTLFTRRSPTAVVAGLTVSLTLFGSVIGFLGFLLSRRVVAMTGGALLIAMGFAILVPSVEMRLTQAASRLQTAVRRLTYGGDFVLGMSLGAAWSPCIAPYAGLAIVASMISGDVVRSTLYMFSYAAGISSSIYILLRAARKVGSRFSKKLGGGRKISKLVKYVAAAASIVAGLYLIATA